MKTKILHVIRNFDTGGVEVNSLSLIEALGHEKFEHHVAYCKGGNLEINFQNSSKIKLFKLSPKDHKGIGFFCLAAILKIVFYIYRNKIKILHTYNFYGHFWGAFAAKAAGVKVVEHVRDYRYCDRAELKKRFGESRLYKYIRLFKGLSDVVVVLTEQNRDFLVNNHFYDSSSVRIVPNGIPINNKIRINTGGNIKHVFTAARMHKTKNIDLIFKIAPSVIKEVPGADFIIAGDGPLLEEYRALVSGKGLRRYIHLIGFSRNIYEHLNNASVFLLPSFIELHSIAILEAMNAGLPVVVSRGAGCNDTFIKNWKNGVLLDPFSPDGWAEAIIKLLSDDELRMNMGRRAFDTCSERFDIKKTSGEIEKIYAELSKNSC